ncbi:membrane protein insertase YidC [Candidatus Cardinium hertigii]|jgi:YidC/Oxa1 family membrane protein insertase|uniref:Membrane protein insertase YidC n=1 Tax=Candidatus Cardinium hertigii TaxID=247481 RepID=A0A3N2QAS0_9BACT|nr:membrane protein insertase YidC [Candidatus Cardinium hertigii]ROT46884.1 membrane protein insertase YidC [Candidatus Cardinium hertigii]
MDTNKIIRLLLISTSFSLVYFYILKPKSETQPTTCPVGSEKMVPLGLPSPSDFGMSLPFAAALQGQEKYITVENELFKVFLSSKGGTIKRVVLKKYKDKDGKELALLDKQSNMGLVFPYKDFLIETQALFFQTAANTLHTLKGTQQASIVFRLALSPSQYLEQCFEFSGNSYKIHYAWRAVGMEEYLNKACNASFQWQMDMKSLEADSKADMSKSTINYYLSDRTFGGLEESSTKAQKKKLEAPIKWVSLTQRFFSSAIIADDIFATGDISMEPILNKQDVTKAARLSLTLSAKEKEEGRSAFTFFFGPNDYKTLQKVTEGFEQNLPLGWAVFKWVNKGLIIPLFYFLEKYFSNYGLIIFLVVIIIKLLLAPLSYKSFISMAKMKVIKPELDKIKEKYGNNLQKVQTEQLAFYRELGINPLSSCIPMLLQIPILCAMFNFFPNAIALRQVPFLWAHDLSTYDSIIRLPFTIPVYGSHVSLFTLLMVLATIFSNHSQSSATEGPMKGLSYIMPLAFMFMLNSSPAGLSFYYFIQTVMTSLQQKLIKYFVNQEDIKEKLMATQQKRAKQGEKPSFQSRVAAAIQANNKKKK